MMKNKDLSIFFNGLESVGKLNGFKFAFAVAKNLDLVRSELIAFQKASEPSKEFAEYETKREELCVQFSEKTPEGEPIILNNNYVIKDGKRSFDLKIKALKEDFKKALEIQDKKVEESRKYLEEDCEVQLIILVKSEIPDDINAEQLRAIKYMIKDY